MGLFKHFIGACCFCLQGDCTRFGGCWGHWEEWLTNQWKI